MRNTPEKYGIVSIFLHWLVALAIFGLFALGWYMVDLSYYDRWQNLSLTAHRALGCRGVSRTDFRWDEARGAAGLVLLETNTQPGMTATSLAPEQGAHCGMTFPDFCAWMVEDASCDR